MSPTLLCPSDLTALDRCDRCGAQAHFRAVLLAGDLLFCNHHGRAYGERLAAAAVRIQDRRPLVDRRAAF